MTAAMGNLEACVHDYQDNHSSEALDDIVTQVDSLVLRVVHHMLRSYQGMVDVDFDDLYQMGIIAVIRAVGSLPDDFDENEIRMRVIAYVKAAIKSQFTNSRRQLAYKCSIVRVGSISDESMHLQVEVRELFNLLIYEHVMSREDFYFMYYKFVDEMSVRELADKYERSSTAIINWERRLLRTLRLDLRVRSFGCVD